MNTENLYYHPIKSENVIGPQVRKAFNPKNFNNRIAAEEKNGFDLNEELIINKQSTYCMRVNTDVMQEAGIFKNDIIVIDRLLKATSGKIIIAKFCGEMLIRRFEKNDKKIRLIADSKKLAPIIIDSNCEDFIICGVVTYVIHKP